MVTAGADIALAAVAADAIWAAVEPIAVVAEPIAVAEQPITVVAVTRWRLLMEAVMRHQLHAVAAVMQHRLHMVAVVVVTRHRPLTAAAVNTLAVVVADMQVVADTGRSTGS